ncbi:MAG: tRNA (N6-threonylcarbamoyladenosine(37)-N6)-methyltransferase TrmO [Bacteriovoracaceae bacterium]|jgi:tRNA (adenine37-N6)-methyltransferase|nr:tRNA (N6-threonylcarbamoyladenosine(37)-N6)-methyltransferase TrmO [Bacteriovoracaceae bacterium]
MKVELTTIGEIHSPFKEKFGVPRQSGLVDVKQTIVIEPYYSYMDAFSELTEHKYIWVIFIFDNPVSKVFRPKVRPPRLGGNKKWGVFSTRSPFRPNPIGMSKVKLTGIKKSGGAVVLEIEGGDFLHLTKVVDIKPHIAYCDNVSEPTENIFRKAPEKKVEVSFSRDLFEDQPEIKKEINDILALDPRPAYQVKKDHYSFKYQNLDVTFKVTDQNQFHVVSTTEISE